CLDEAIRMADVKGFAERKSDAAKRGKLRGLGYASYIEACGIAPSNVAGSLGARAGLFEAGEVRVHPTGSVTVFTGSHSHGQGHETTFAQVVATRLGIPIENVDVVHGDTGRGRFGMGTSGSRSLAVGRTGVVSIVSFSACDDFGNIINPMIVEGQVHGGLCQGIGQAMLEHCIYDSESGQLLTGSLMDYALPRADDVPSFKVETKVTPCTH